MKKLLSICLILLCLGYTLSAQTGDLKGIVYDKESGEPIPGATVELLNTAWVVAADNDGYFIFTKVPAGNYTLRVTSLSYDTSDQQVSIVSARVGRKDAYLNRVYTKGRVVVTGKSQRTKREVMISTTSINQRELGKLPTIGGEPDLVQYLQVLPGVVFTGDQGGQLYIRGGSPVMNRVMLDGMTIYNPFHSIGLFSIFDSDLIKTADVSSAGFNSEYGGRVSAIVDVRTRDGNRNRLAGKVSVNTFSSKLLLEGPIRRKKESKTSNTFALSYKNSYLEQSSKLFYNYADPSRLPYNFSDLYGKISFNSSTGNYLKLYGFNFNDQVNFPNTTRYNWTSTGMGGKFLVIPEESKTRIDGVFSYSDYGIRQIESDQKPRNSGIAGFNAGMNFTFAVKTDEVKFGIELNGFRTKFEIYNANDRFIDQNENTTEINSYGYYRFIRGNYILQAGMRTQFYASLGNSSFEPRLSYKYFITPKLYFKAAGGYYSQNLLSAFSDRDVVNLFYGFLSGPDNLPETFNGQAVKHKLQKSRHAVAGIEWEPNTMNNLQVEAYIKDFTQITNINRDKLFDDDEYNQDKPAILRQDYIIETGKAYGADMKYKMDLGRVYFWAVYSLTYVTRFDGIRTYSPNFDRRHNINLLGNLELGKNRQTEVSLRWNFGSGFPFTQTQGFFEKFSFSGGLGSNYTTDNGQLGIIYSPLNQGRLPYYHRLDFSLQQRLKFRNGNKMNIIFSCTNVYDRKNIFYFDRFKYVRIDQLPILPSLGINYSF